MVNLRLIYKIIGSLLFLLGALLLVSCGISVYYQEDDMLGFLISALFTFCAGLVLKYFGNDANNTLSRRDSYLLVSVTWVVFSLFGMLPFLISGYITSVTNAFFETMSGFSTTGATILDDVEWLPHATLYWRTQTQWIGGLGIVFFTIAIRQGFRRRSHGPLALQDAPSAFNHGQVDMDCLPGAYRCLHTGLLGCRHGLV